MPVLARGLLGRDRGLGDGHIGGVAGEQADGSAGPLDQAAGDRVRPVPELGRGGQDPLLGFDGNAHVTAVEDLAGRLEADPGARRDFLDRHVPPPCHRVLPPGPRVRSHPAPSPAGPPWANVRSRTLDPPATSGQVGVSKMFRPRYTAATAPPPRKVPRPARAPVLSRTT